MSAFPRARWAAALWLAVWLPAYALTWGWRNFFALCDVAVVLACLGAWRGNSLLLSAAALPSYLVGALWTADVLGRVATGAHFLGGTEYMWDARASLAVRLMSLFHVALPVLLVPALRRTGYDGRALALQTLLTLPLVAAGRLLAAPAKNLNYAFRDPLLGRQWGPPALHVAVITLGAALLVYLPTHLALRRWIGRGAGSRARPAR